MSDQFVGEIRLFPYLRGAPVNWLLCSGQILNISDYQTLFSVIGATYGGNGTSNFALPNLNGRLPIGTGALTGGGTYSLGQGAGSDEMVLTAAQGVVHDHTFQVSSAVGTQSTPGTGVLFSALPTGNSRYAVPPTTNPNYSKLSSATISDVGGYFPHDNLMPSIAIYYCICFNGTYPQRN